MDLCNLGMCMKSTLRLDLTGFGNLSGLIQHCRIYFMHIPYLTKYVVQRIDGINGLLIMDIKRLWYYFCYARSL